MIIIPFKNSYKDRQRNIDIVLEYLLQYTDKVLVCEYDNEQKFINRFNVEYLFIKEQNKYFNKSICINNACVYLFKKGYEEICIWDADVLCDYNKYLLSNNKIKNKLCDVCFPYNGCVYNISIQDIIRNKFEFNKYNLDEYYSESSIGGIISFSKKIFLEVGGYNELLEGWGNEDYEFYLKIKFNECKIDRINGHIYHIKHFRKKEDITSERVKKHKEIIQNILHLDKELFNNYIRRQRNEFSTRYYK